MKKLFLGLAGILSNFIGYAQTPSYTWAVGQGDVNSQIGLAITTDAAGNSYTTGKLFGTVDFDPGAGIFNLSSSAVGTSAVFICKLDINGNFVWAKSVGPPSGAGTNTRGLAIKVDPWGNIYISGQFDGTADFDPGAGVSNLTSTGGGDIFIMKLDAAGNFIWAKKMGAGAFDAGICLALDPVANVYTIGNFNGTVDFDPGAGVSNLTSSGLQDAFISKLDAAGNFVWAKKFGGANNESGYAIGLDGSGNIFTTGFFETTADFDPGPGVSNLISAGARDTYVTKLDAAGNFVWAKKFGGTGNEQPGFSLGIDASGNVLTSGFFESTADFDPGAGVVNLISAGLKDIYVSKLDAAGNFVWAKQMGGTGIDQSWGLSLDGAYNVYSIGAFNSTVDFDPSASVFNLSSAGADDIFVSILDPLGNFVCSGNIGGAQIDIGWAVAVSNVGNIYSTGQFSNISDFDPAATVVNLTSAGSDDIFVSKLGTCPVFLPIELVSFTAKGRDNKDILCQWSTASETNNDHFIVERSSDALSFDSVAKVAGAGNSTKTLYYSCVDTKPFKGTSYYRLKQVDFSGTFHYSQIVAVNLTGLEILNIYPNPSTSEGAYYHIESLTAVDIKITVTDHLGRIVIQKDEHIEAGLTKMKLNTASLAEGNYILHVATANNEIKQKLFVIK